MFARPGHLSRQKDPLDDIHNDPDQPIQGGIPGEHYHLSGTLYQHLINIAEHPIYSEPVMTLGGEIMTSLSGDIMMVLVNGTTRTYAADYVAPPIAPISPIPDIVSPPVPTPAPVPSDVIASPQDPYWNNVICSMPLNSAVGVTDHVDVSQYNYAGFIAGGNSAGSAIKQLFGRNTVAAANAGAFLKLAAKSSQPTATFAGDFTVEAHLLNSTTVAQFHVGNSILSVKAIISPNGTGKFCITRYGVDASGSESDTFSFNHSTTAFHHWCIERVNNTLQLKIDGVVQAEVTSNAIFNELFMYANYYANLRVTQGVARYANQAITPPSTWYPTR